MSNKLNATRNPHCFLLAACVVSSYHPTLEEQTVVECELQFSGRFSAMKSMCCNKTVHRAMFFFLEMLLVCGFTMPMLAQFTTARLSGTVLDPSGLGLAGATVTVKFAAVQAYLKATFKLIEGQT